MQKSTKEATGAEKKFFLFFTAQLSLSFSGEKGRASRTTFLFPHLSFSHTIFSPCGVLDRARSLSLKHGVGFFFFQFLSTRVFAFWQLAAGQPHWTLIQLSWIELFQIELNFFLNELNFFHPWRIAKESNQTTKKPIKEERWKTKQKKERSGFSINT